MNLNRRKNIFTLGDFQHKPTPFIAGLAANQSRRQNSDPFERDPFKIQSYNFRYAERPTFPLQNLVNRVSNNNPSEKRFETYYYNHDFATPRHDKENSSTNKFHEHRRRKFINDQTNSTSTPHSRLSSYYQQSNQQSQHSNQAQTRDAATATTTTIGTSTTTATSSTNSHTTGNKSSSAIASPYANAFGNSPTSSPLLRRGCAREFMQGIRTIYAPSIKESTHSLLQQHQSVHSQSSETNRRSSGCHPAESNSRSSLAAGRSSSGRRIISQSERYPSICGYNSSTSIPIRSGREQHNSASHTRTISSQQNLNRSQASHSNRVQPSQSTCSGCRININIKGLDENQTSDNLVIQIESDRPANIETTTNDMNETKRLRLHNTPSISNNLSHKTTSPNMENFNIGPYRSSDTFTINKRISKFSIAESETGNDRNNGLDTKVSVSKAGNSLKRTVSDRIPSLVPWKTSESTRVCFLNNSNPSSKLSYADYSGPQRRQRSTGQNSSRVNQSRSKPMVPTVSAIGLTKSNGNRSMTIRNGSKTTTTTTSTGVNTSTTGIPKSTISKSTNVNNKTSRTSLRSNCENISVNLTNNRRLPDSQLRKSASCIYTTRRSLDKSPVNVNINVFADKLKLMRV